MSEAVAEDGAPPARVRVNPRRAAPTHPMHKRFWPWYDRSGRFSWLKAFVLTLEIEPGAWIAYALLTESFGARPITEAIHQTGLWSIRFLMLSLLVTPLRAIFNWHRLVLVRRQLGVTSLLYALAHLVLYCWDEKWVGTTIATEILSRFYLLVGLVAIVGLAFLGATSTDRALRALGHAWKRMHKLVYPLAGLALFHYFLQSKADASEAVVIAGLFIWMMGWRVMPSGPDRQPLPILGLGIAAALLSAAFEYVWYALATKANPTRVLLAELDWSFGPHSAGQVLLICLCLALVTTLYWAGQRDRFRTASWFGAAAYGVGSAVAVTILYAFNLTDAWLPDSWEFWQLAVALLLSGLILGRLRTALPRRQRWLDAACAVAVFVPVMAGLTAT